jgi:hypothetical protein
MEEISIESVAKRFEEHLNIEGNNRIIFSGKFGTGKTYFLNKFFEDRPAAYNKFIISPANYVVSSNEDIFELIKADIVKDLFFTKKIEERKSAKRSKLQKVDLFVGENPQHLIKFITSSFKKINPFFEIADDFYEGLKTIIGEFKKYEKELEKELQTSEEILSEFLNSFLDTKGSLFEHDFFTRTINSVLDEKRENGTKSNVLIIDDLDRIDPDHIFRILNFLSAHNNHFGAENKFQFDHVVIVCDINNIQKIFAHRYGQNVDFDGYMDKFYSTDIFFFSNLDAMNVYVDGMEIPFSNQSGILKKIIKLILTEFIVSNKITIRKLIKHKIQFDLKTFRLFTFPKINPNYYGVNGFRFINSDTSINVDSSDLDILYVLKFMTILFGNFGDFLASLNSCLKESRGSKEIGDFEDVIFYLGLQKHISLEVSEKLFLEVDTYYDDFRRTKIISAIKWPGQELILNGRSCRIILNWINGNQYNGSESFFVNAKIISKNSNDAAENINTKLIFHQLETIINQCYKNKYLEKVGIIY